VKASRAPTIRDVAARAGVSIATASNVVSGNRPVGPDSRARVNAAIETLGYRLNRAASSLRGLSTKLVGFVVPDIANVFFAALAQGIEELAERDGYDLVLVSSSEDPAIERRRIEALVARRLDGLIVVPARDDTLARFGERALPPTVLLDRGEAGMGFDTVRAECEKGAYAATRHLIELGHRNIALLGHGAHLANIRARIAGYERALAEASLAQRSRICLSEPGVDRLRASIELELHRADRPSAIFALTNHAALAAIKAARGLGFDIPRDVSIAGFDDFDWMSALRPYLTTVAQPIDEFATQSWRLLMRRIADPAPSATEAIELPCALKVRESTGPARLRLRTAASR